LWGAAAAATVAARPGPDETPLIPRSVLFGNPDRARALLSPDGQKVSYLSVAGDAKVLNVCVGPAEQPAQAKPITRDTKRGIMRYWWAADSKHIVYLQDRDGDEDWHIYSTPVEAGATIDLTPFEEIPGPDGKPLIGRDGKPMRPSARLIALDEQQPTRAIVAVNNRDPRLHDLYTVDLITGAHELVEKAPENTVDWVVDNALSVRFAVTFADDGGQVWLRPGLEHGAWDAAITFSADDALTSSPIGFTTDNQTLYLQDCRGRDTTALYTLDLANGGKSLIAQDHAADLADVLIHPTTKLVQAVSFNRLKTDWVILDESVREDFKTLASLGRGDVKVVSRSKDDKTWLVLLAADDGPNKYYLYKRALPAPGVEPEPGHAEFLFADREALSSQPLSQMRPLIIHARDGLEMVSYLTLPLNAAPAGSLKPAKPLPMVLLVHGGPWARDEWGYSSLHQLLANRGYAVLSVNYRGSTGFGKSFVNAARREWAGKMHDDLIDAVNWAIDERIADKEKIAIMGGSYGGYAALVGLTFTPETFACGVDIVGPSNLVTLMESIPEYWKPGMAMWRTRVGDNATEEGREFLKSRSPLTYVGKITRPLLIGHGVNDPRVKIEESTQIVEAMKSRHIPVTYVVYPDEGHGFLRPENRTAFFGIAEAFLSKRLGGRCEPLGEVVAKSSAQVRTGAGDVPGLDAAIRGHAK
jgi:dipeptidyl aminopeptidase/acylaminoacyl peptidase